MKYHPDDIAPIDVWEYLGRNEGRFFRSGSFDAVKLAGMITTEALIKGAGSVHIVSEEDWLTVKADFHWLGDQEQEAFRALTPFPESGANGMLAEILAVGFSEGVATASPQGVMVIKGDSAPVACTADRGVVRAVSFRRRRSNGSAAEV